MKLKINVGQIFLTHPKDQNFASVYEESFSRDGGNVDLFAVIEVASASSQMLKANKADYDNLSKTIVAALKRTYVSSPVVNEDTFEKALANINSSLSRLGSKEKIIWFGRLNAALGAVIGKQLFLSVVGNGLVYLYRDGEPSLLSEGLADEKPKPTKLFANYSSGGLASGDRVVLSNRALLNFLSQQRLNSFLGSETLEDTCEEIIMAVSDVKDTGFATYIFETYSGDKPPAPAPSKIFTGILGAKKTPGAASRGRDLAGLLEIAKYAAVSVFGFLWRYLTAAVKFVIHFFRVRPKKYLFAAITVVLILFVGNLALASWRKNNKAVVESQTSVISAIEQKLDDAESALIYNNENGAINLVTEIEAMLEGINTNSPDRTALENRLLSLKNKVSREVRVDNPTALTQFGMVPTNLLRSPNGFLGFNKNSGRLAFYDFRIGSTKQILANQNTGNLSYGVFLGAGSGYGFFHKDGKIVRLDVDSESLADIAASSGTDVSLSDLSRGRGLAVFGENSNARLYILDHKNQQIWRMNVNDTGIAAPERWLKTAADFGEARDIAVDGSVYVLYGDHLEKYFNGTKQNFQMSALTPPAKNLAGIFTGQDLTSIYVLDPDNKRIIILDKQGSLQKQIISDRFREISDVFVDEKTGLLQALSGSELLQISIK